MKNSFSKTRVAGSASILAFAVGTIMISVTLQPFAAQAALPQVCELVGRPSPHGVSASDFESYQDRLIKECELSEKKAELENRARTSYAISLEQISLYQGLRYLERSAFDKSREANLPLELTYQIAYADYQKPIAERSPIIWKNWVNGLPQLERIRQKINSGRKLTLEDLLRSHAGFYQLSNEYCEKLPDGKRCGHNNDPHPGQLKPSTSLEPDRYWWKFDSVEEAMKAKQSAEEFNRLYSDLGLLGMIYGEDGAAMSDVISVRKSGDQYAMYSGDSKANPQHLDGLLRFVNQSMAEFHQGRHVSWNGKLMTPGQIAMLAQQYLVQIHPFAEGNGRMSRLLQEAILTSFGMPHGASGDLMDGDVLMSPNKYYDLSIKATWEHLIDVEHCLTSVYVDVLGGGPGAQLQYMDQKRIPYECRIL